MKSIFLSAIIGMMLTSCIDPVSTEGTKNPYPDLFTEEEKKTIEELSFLDYKDRIKELRLDSLSYEQRKEKLVEIREKGMQSWEVLWEEFHPRAENLSKDERKAVLDSLRRAYGLKLETRVSAYLEEKRDELIIRLNQRKDQVQQLSHD